MLIFVFKIFAKDLMTNNNTTLHPHADFPLRKKKKKPSAPFSGIVIVFIYGSKEILS